MSMIYTYVYIVYFLKLEKTATKFLLQRIVEINFFHIYINSKSALLNNIRSVMYQDYKLVI